MKSRLISCIRGVILLGFISMSLVTTTKLNAQTTKRWKVVWEENFNEDKIDYNVWSKIPRMTSDWNNTMSDQERLFEIRDGKLILKGIVNDDKTKDKSDYLTGGLWTSGKKSFMGGKIEVRAKFNSGQGAWPAIWLMPFEQKQQWPLEGEIDIMEHLNFDGFVYQTVHSNYTWNLKQKAGSHQTTAINKDGFNVYGVEMRADKLVFYVNGNKTFEYRKDPSKQDQGQFPFYREMHLILSMQLGGSWVGAVNPKHLPLEMEVDWIKHYQIEELDTPKDEYPTWDEIEHPRAYGDARIVQNLKVEGATVNEEASPFTTAVAGENATSQNKVYFNKTEDILQASLGDELTVRPKVKDMMWMHYYLYIDYNQNKQFEDDELVSYSAKEKDGKWFNSEGKIVTIDNVPETLPSFTIPTTAKLGKTRVRFKVDWDNLNPAGNMSEDNLLSNNGGTICDFTIDIHKAGKLTAVENLDKLSVLKIYPNPTQQFFKIEATQKLESLRLYTLTGQLVRLYPLGFDAYPIGDLAKGSYMLSIKVEGKLYNKLLVIE